MVMVCVSNLSGTGAFASIIWGSIVGAVAVSSLDQESLISESAVSGGMGALATYCFCNASQGSSSLMSLIGLGATLGGGFLALREYHRYYPAAAGIHREPTAVIKSLAISVLFNLAARKVADVVGHNG